MSPGADETTVRGENATHSIGKLLIMLTSDISVYTLCIRKPNPCPDQ